MFIFQRKMVDSDRFFAENQKPANYEAVSNEIKSFCQKHRNVDQNNAQYGCVVCTYSS